MLSCVYLLRYNWEQQLSPRFFLLQICAQFHTVSTLNNIMWKKFHLPSWFSASPIATNITLYPPFTTSPATNFIVCLPSTTQCAKTYIWPQLLERLITLFSRLHIPWITQWISPKFIHWTVIYSVYNAIQRLNNQGLWSTAHNIIVYHVYSVDMDKFNRVCTFCNSGSKCHHVSTLCSIVQNKFIVCLTLENIEHNKRLHVFYFCNIARNKFFPSYALRLKNFIVSPFC